MPPFIMPSNFRAARAQKKKTTVIGPGTLNLKANYPNNDNIVPELYEKVGHKVSPGRCIYFGLSPIASFYFAHVK